MSNTLGIPDNIFGSNTFEPENTSATLLYIHCVNYECRFSMGSRKFSQIVWTNSTVFTRHCLYLLLFQRKYAQVFSIVPTKGK